MRIGAGENRLMRYFYGERFAVQGSLWWRYADLWEIERQDGKTFGWVKSVVLVAEDS